MKIFKEILHSIYILSKIYTLNLLFKHLILEIIYEAKVKDYLINKYLKKPKYLIENFESKNNCQIEYKHKIWQLWYQGEDYAPLIVKKCMHSVKKFSNGQKIIILTEKNIENYVEIPGYIFDKKKRGEISNVNFSDIVRACLLSEHGGTWLDATVMLTGSIPSFILNNPLFCFSTTPEELRGIGNILSSSWFIHAFPNSIILESIKDLYFDFWKKESNCKHHYLFHLMFSSLISQNKSCEKEWASVPFFSNVPPHVLQMELFNEFNKERFEQIKSMSAIHKLTFYGKDDFQDNLLIENTFYAKLTK